MAVRFGVLPAVPFARSGLRAEEGSSMQKRTGDAMHRYWRWFALLVVIAGALMLPAAAGAWSGVIRGASVAPGHQDVTVSFRAPGPGVLNAVGNWVWDMDYSWESFDGLDGAGTGYNFWFRQQHESATMMRYYITINSNYLPGTDITAPQLSSEGANAPNHWASTTALPDRGPVSVCGVFNNTIGTYTYLLAWHATRLPDRDGDGIPESGELPIDIHQPCLPTGYDNCPDDFNPWQEDSDGDGRGDACDLEPPTIVYPLDDLIVDEEGPVSFPVSAHDRDGPVPVDCVPPSGSYFSVGSTLVTCTASNAGGSTTITFNVIVPDAGDDDETPGGKCDWYKPTYRLGYGSADVFEYALDVLFCYGGSLPLEIRSARFQSQYILNRDSSFIAALWRLAGFSWQAPPSGDAYTIEKRPDGSFFIGATPNESFKLCHSMSALLSSATGGLSRLLGNVPLSRLPSTAITRQFSAIWTLLLTPLEKSFVTVPFDEIAQKFASEGLGKLDEVCARVWHPTIELIVHPSGQVEVIDYPTTAEWSWLTVRAIVGPS
jgi:hypothetical protein